MTQNINKDKYILVLGNSAFKPYIPVHDSLKQSGLAIIEDREVMILNMWGFNNSVYHYYRFYEKEDKVKILHGLKYSVRDILESITEIKVFGEVGDVFSKTLISKADKKDGIKITQYKL